MFRIPGFFIHLILFLRSVLRDNRGEWKIPDEKQTYTVNGITYTVSPHYAKNEQNTADLCAVFKRLVKTHAAVLTVPASDGIIKPEPVPAAERKE